MIEGDVGPARRLMAAFAIGTKGALMGVIFLVAIDAKRRKPVINLVGVAGVALDGLMLAYQGKTGRRMVERYFFPVVFNVAGLALPPQPAFMWLVFFMAIHAVVRGVAKLLTLLMATLAIRLLVGPFQHEVR